MAKRISMIYKGGGAWLHGVPNRDLTKEEVKRFGRDRLLKSGLYESKYKRKPKSKKVVKPIISKAEDKED